MSVLGGTCVARMGERSATTEPIRCGLSPGGDQQASGDVQAKAVSGQQLGGDLADQRSHLRAEAQLLLARDA